jgi:hypothetical protein
MDGLGPNPSRAFNELARHCPNLWVFKIVSLHPLTPDIQMRFHPFASKPDSSESSRQSTVSPDTALSTVPVVMSMSRQVFLRAS